MVTCVNAEDAQEFSEETDADGAIAEQTITVKSQTPEPDRTGSCNGGVVTDYGPFTFTITAAGYRDHSIEAEIDAATDWDVALTPNTSLDWAEIYGTVELPVIEVDIENDETAVTVNEDGASITVEDS
jgi:hypothetical protein